MPLYLAAARPLNVVKIGFANDVRRRLLLIGAACPAPIELLATRDGDKPLEFAIHRTARPWHVHGEWFRLDPGVETAFLSTPVPVRQRDGIHAEIEAAIAIVGSQRRLAELTGLAQQMVSKLLYKERGISAETAVAIERATDGKVARSALRPDLWTKPPPNARRSPAAYYPEAA
jgi:DNA-binding transcriptional regulator YdaS (Cro superfamily)